MALSLSPPTTTSHQPRVLPIKHTTNSAAARRSPPPSIFTAQYPSAIHLHRASPPLVSNPYARPRRCQAVSPGRPPPPESEEGIAATLARLQDTVQIFFAVLFWMSLYFWASAWDGRNDGRPGKGSRFRR